MRGSLAERLHVAEQIADDSAARYADRIAAVGLLLRYGLGSVDEQTVGQRRAAETEGYMFEVEKRTLETPEAQELLIQLWDMVHPAPIECNGS